jgi:mRNA interferase MazF
MSGNPLRGQIWRVRLDPTVGDEMQKTRPVVVISSDRVGRLDLRWVVPVADWKERHGSIRWMIRVDPTKGNGLTKASAIDTFQLRSVSTLRFVEHLGALPPQTLNTVALAISWISGYDPTSPR